MSDTLQLVVRVPRDLLHRIDEETQARSELAAVAHVPRSDVLRALLEGQNCLSQPASTPDSTEKKPTRSPAVQLVVRVSQKLMEQLDREVEQRRKRSGIQTVSRADVVRALLDERLNKQPAKETPNSTNQESAG